MGASLSRPVSADESLGTCANRCSGHEPASESNSFWVRNPGQPHGYLISVVQATSIVIHTSWEQERLHGIAL